MINPEQKEYKELPTTEISGTTIQQLAQVAHEGTQTSIPKPGDWVEILDYCSYWGLDIPGLPIQGTP